MVQTVGIWEGSGDLEQLLLDSLGDEEKAGLLLRSGPVHEPFMRGGLAQLSVSIQRELLTLGGDLIERQELQLQRLEGVNPMLLLACTGLLLVLGKPPEEVPGLLARY